MKRINSVLLELTIGIGLYGLAVQGVILFLGGNRRYHSLGLWAGVLLAVFMAFHLQFSITRAVEKADHAKGAMAGGYALRMGVVFGVLGLLHYFQIGNGITGFVGAMGLKIGVYLQPFIHKIINKNQR